LSYGATVNLREGSGGHSHPEKYRRLEKKSMVLICTKNVQIVKRQRGDIMLPINYISGIIRDAHVACGLKGETKTHKKVQEHYANVSMTAVKDVIRKCEKS